MKKPNRCIDPVLKRCEDCQFGSKTYVDDIDFLNDVPVFFETHCIHGLQDTVPTSEEMHEFEEWYNRQSNNKE